MKRPISISIMFVIILGGFSGLLIFTPSEVHAEYTPHDPIHISGDEDFAAQGVNESWPGNGTRENPYIIEGYEINASTDKGIDISWTDAHFIIRDSRIFDGEYLDQSNYGIDLWAPNGTIENCALENNSVGIYLHSSNNVEILNNTFNSNSGQDIIMQGSNNNKLSGNSMGNNGIYILGDWLSDVNTHDIDTSNTVNGKPIRYIKNQTNGVVSLDAGQIILANCTNMLVENLDIRNTANGIQLIFSSFNTVVNNTFDSCSDGIYLLRSTNNLITHNIISNNTVGIELERESNGNKIENNQIHNNFYGIILFISSFNDILNNNILDNWAGIGTGWDSVGNHIENNTVSYNSECGFELSNARENIFLNNVVSHSDYGIRLWQNSSNNKFENNKIMNTSYGYFSYYCDTNNIINNNFSGNERGISSFYSSKDNIKENTISDNYLGIYLNNSASNIIINNSIDSNEYGIYFIYSNGNNLAWNEILNNNFGLDLRNSNNNVIHHNDILNNSIQLNRTKSKNTWADANDEGNFWSDYMGFDKNRDGIGDTDLPHQGVDYFPLTDRFVDETKSDETAFFLPIYLTFLIITLIIVILVLRKRKAKGESSDEDQGILPREL